MNKNQFTQLNIKDIILVKYPYEDDHTKYKARPALIIDKDGTTLEVMVIKITSQSARDATDYDILNWFQANLKKPSVARTSKIEVILYTQILRHIGTMTNSDYNQIMNML